MKGPQFLAAVYTAIVTCLLTVISFLILNKKDVLHLTNPATEIPAAPLLQPTKHPLSYSELLAAKNEEDFDSVKSHYNKTPAESLTYRSLLDLAENCPAFEIQWFVNLLEHSDLDPQTQSEILGHFTDQSNRGGVESYRYLLKWLTDKQGRGRYFAPAIKGVFTCEAIPFASAVGDLDGLTYPVDRDAAIEGLSVRLISTWDVSTLDFSEISISDPKVSQTISDGLAANLENETASQQDRGLQSAIQLISQIPDKTQGSTILRQFLIGASTYAPKAVLKSLPEQSTFLNAASNDAICQSAIEQIALRDPRMALEMVPYAPLLDKSRRSSLAESVMSEYLSLDYQAANHWLTDNPARLDQEFADGIKFAIAEHNAREGAPDLANHWIALMSSPSSREEARSRIRSLSTENQE